MSKQSISVASPSLPKGGGALRGIGETFQPNAFSGTASLSIPIHTSPCRGFEPTLSLDYNSGSGNGFFGLGFGLTLPNVARKTEKGIPRYDDSDTFILSNADDLVPALVLCDGMWQPDEAYLTDPASGERTTHIRRFRPRTEGLFARIEARTRLSDGDVYWQVTTKDNVTSTYGHSPDTRVADPADPTRVFQWLIEESRDAKGNLVRYEYRPESGRPLRRILYGNHVDAGGQEQWHFEVTFDYGERSLDDLQNLSYNPIQPTVHRADPFSSYRSGFCIRTELLCRAILMFHRFEHKSNGEPFAVHCTRFDYEETPYVSQLTQATQIGLRKDACGYLHKTLPPLKLSYSKSRELGAAVAEFAPLTVRPDNDTRDFLLQQPIGEMADLYGDGVPGVLFSDDQTTLFWRAQGDGCYAPPTMPSRFPIERDLRTGRLVLTDMDGDGKLDLVVHSPAFGGYFRGNRDGTWDAFQSFAAYPLDSFAPDCQTADLTGDGLTDVVLFETETVKVYPSQGKHGFASAIECLRERDLPITSRTSPQDVVRFADMFGDGGSHIVRISNGTVSVWPHLGYGRYGPRIDMENAPQFDGQFDAARFFLADLDGSGTPDLIYAHHDHLAIYRNQSGNGFGKREVLPLPHAFDSLDQIRFADVLGSGSACLVLTTRQANLALRHDYYDFSGGAKPHLLIEVDNNMGAQKRIRYAPSTRFYLADQRSGRPWRTRLSFPVQVIESVEVIDQIAGTRQVTRYAYHDGYFDPVEREFRGFGFVEQWDTESPEDFKNWRAGTDITAGSAAEDDAAYVAPVYTRTWYHNGAPAEGDMLSSHYQDDYYHSDSLAHHLPDSVPECRILFTLGDLELLSALSPMVPPGEPLCQAFAKQGVDLSRAAIAIPISDGKWRISSAEHGCAYGLTREDDCLVVTDENWQMQPADDLYEAYRALHGHELRREVYGDDAAQNPHLALHPYIVTESNFTVRLVQPRLGQRHAVCFAHPRETITGHYERNPDDPRVEHEFTVEVDEYGHTLKSCHFVYGRRGAEASPEQQQWRAVATVDRLANVVPDANEPADYLLLGVPIEEQIFELGGLAHLSNLDKPVHLSSAEVARHLREALATVVNHEESPSKTVSHARRLSWIHHYYWDKVQESPLPLGQVTAQELHHHSEYAVFSTRQVEAVFEGRVTDTMLHEGGYRAAAQHWWNPGLTQQYHGADHYYLPTKTIDPFGAKTVVTYDQYDLISVSTTDALGNQTQAEIDYYTLQPWRITDINDNKSEVLFDPLGMVIASAIYKGENDQLLAGDRPLINYKISQETNATEILARPEDFLQQATTAFFYDLFSWTDGRQQPPYTIRLLRETHVHDLPPDEATTIQIHIDFTDGFGRALQAKVKARSGPAFLRDDQGMLQREAAGKLLEGETDLRWLTSGRTVYNNKGMPVKQYESFYGSTAHYESEHELTEYGVTHITHYDPLRRAVRVDTPDRYFSSVDFTPWQERHFDENDTFPESPFYNTPETHLLDTQGRSFQIIQQLEGAENLRQLDPSRKLITRYELDIQGHGLSSTDPRGVCAFEYAYDMAGAVLKKKSADAGERWALHNVTGNLIHVWDSRNFHIITDYDVLHRPIQVHVEGDDGQGLVLNHVVEKMVYGEEQADDKKHNLRGQLVQHYDQAGLVEFESYDIKENLLKSTRRLRKMDRMYREEVNWAREEALEDKGHVSEWVHDTLGRVIRETHPDGSISMRQYHPEGWLKQLDVTLARDPEKQVPSINRISYNAKGQRTEFKYGNGVTTTYAYNNLTFRLSRQTTLGKGNEESLQDIFYTYDPAGNITHIRDDAQQTIYFDGQVVLPQSVYSYDATYRLTEARGREHIGQSGRPETGWDDKFNVRQPLPNSGQAMRTYIETYGYDASGNIREVAHQAANGNWTRGYAYDETSLIDSSQNNNRLSSTTIGGATETTCTYDDHGNITGMNHVPHMQWDYRDQLHATTRQVVNNGGTPETTWYVYDAAGQRVCKVTERQNGTRKNERIYLGGFEIYREYEGDGDTIALERETLHVTDDRLRIAMVETTTCENGQEIPSLGALFRYQLGNYLGSASLELDAAGHIISYEEYYPYGSTSYQAVNSQIQVSRKRYRYSGKERDDSTGLYYYGARYYAPWLGRWLSPDPAGTVDGLNLYAFVQGNPIGFIDNTGLCRTHMSNQTQRAQWEHGGKYERREAKFQGSIGPSGSRVETGPIRVFGREFSGIGYGNTNAQNANQAASGGTGRVKNLILPSVQQETLKKVTKNMKDEEQRAVERNPEVGKFLTYGNRAELVATAAKAGGKGGPFNPASSGLGVLQRGGNYAASKFQEKALEKMPPASNPKGRLYQGDIMLRSEQNKKKAIGPFASETIDKETQGGLQLMAARETGHSSGNMFSRSNPSLPETLYQSSGVSDKQRGRIMRSGMKSIEAQQAQRNELVEKRMQKSSFYKNMSK